MNLPWCCLCTFDSCDGVLSVLGLMRCGLPLCGVLHRVLVHAGVSGQQTHVVLLAIVADGSPVTQRLLEGEEGGEVGEIVEHGVLWDD